MCFAATSLLAPVQDCRISQEPDGALRPETLRARYSLESPRRYENQFRARHQHPLDDGGKIDATSFPASHDQSLITHDQGNRSGHLAPATRLQGQLLLAPGRQTIEPRLAVVLARSPVRRYPSAVFQEV